MRISDTMTSGCSEASFLTIPVPLESVAIAEPGDTIRFRYLLGAEPHLGGDRVGQNETAA